MIEQQENTIKAMLMTISYVYLGTQRNQTFIYQCNIPLFTNVTFQKSNLTQNDAEKLLQHLFLQAVLL